jgi:hypothetical protein
MSGESLFNLRSKFKSKSIQTLSKIANVLQKIVVGNERWDGRQQAGRGGHQGFGDPGSHGAKAGSAGGTKTGKSVNDAPDGAKKANEGCDASGGGEPGHTLFGAAHLFGGGKLHADGDGLHAFELWGRGIAGAGELALQFAVAGSVDVGEGRASGNQALRIGHAFGGPEDSEELVTFSTDAAKQADLLENERPGNQREEEKKAKNAACDPASLRENIENVADVECGQQENNVSPSWKRNFYQHEQRSTRVERGQKK